MSSSYPCQFGKYHLLEKIASGGMAELVKAKITGEHGFEKVLAVKKIHTHFKSEEEMLTAFIDEARLAAQLQHQNIVQIVDFGNVEGDYFMAMEYLDGLDLATILKMAAQAGATLAIDHALYITAKVCDGLHYAHFLSSADGTPLKIVHRDISPANIFITHSGEVKIIDFGIARAASHNRLTMAGSLKGKIRYMAPEQASGGNIDHRTDIYAIGAVLYEMLAGHPLFSSDGFEILDKVKTGQFTPPEQAIANQPPELYHILNKSLASDPGQRYQSCLDMLTDIDSLLTTCSLRPSNRSLKEYVDALPRLDGSTSQQFSSAPTMVSPEAAVSEPEPLPSEPAPAQEREGDKPAVPPGSTWLQGLTQSIAELFQAHLPRLAMAAAVVALIIVVAISLSRRYTAFNIWVPNNSTLYSINFKEGGALLPAGSRIKDIKVDKEAETISFTTADMGRVTIRFAGKWHPGLQVEDFADQLISTKNFNQLSRGLSRDEVEAIKSGQVIDGMSKEAVLLAYGYPPEFSTANLDESRWTYWYGRFTSRPLCFDDSDELLPSCAPDQSADEGSLKNLGGKLRDLFSTP